MKLSRQEFFHVVAGGAAWLVSSGFAQKIQSAVAAAACVWDPYDPQLKD